MGLSPIIAGLHVRDNGAGVALALEVALVLEDLCRAQASPPGRGLDVEGFTS